MVVCTGMQMRTLLVVSVMALVALVAACAYTPKHEATPTVVKLSGDAQRGAPLYETHCAACHGADLKGKEELGPSLKLRLAMYDDARIVDTVLLGRGEKMPPLDTVLEHQDISDVVAYLRSQE